MKQEITDTAFEEAGEWRAIIEWDQTNDKQTMIRAGHRDGVYDRSL